MHKCTIYYLHRGAPGDTKVASGSAISRLGHSFFTLAGETEIPYHRILRIEYDGAVVYGGRCVSESQYSPKPGHRKRYIRIALKTVS